jgi:uncharacterized membrane protein HdeD (DUF308 family)
MSEQVVEKKATHRWLLLVEGVALLILSFLLFTTPVQATQFLVRLLGIYWLVSGIIGIVWIFFDHKQWGWRLLLGILGIIAGLVILEHPLASTILIPTLVIIVTGVLGIMIGMVALIMAFTGSGWGAAVLGILSMIFGIILVANPVFSAIGLPFVLGAVALVGGVGSLVGFFVK